MKFKVTQEDIEKGKPNSSNDCPVARAIKRGLGLEFGVRVGSKCLYLPTEKRLFGIPVPPKVRKWIETYDCTGYSVSEFEFEIEDKELKEAGYLK